MSVTPGRSTRAYFDTPNSVMDEPGWGSSRHHRLIELWRDSPYITDFDIAGLHRWPSGVWSLRPLQLAITNFQEISDFDENVIGLDQWNFKSGNFISVPTYSRPALKDVDPISPTFDMLRKVVHPSDSFDLTIPSDYPKVDRKQANGKPYDQLDRVLESTSTFEANQGFFLYWMLPADFRGNPMVLFRFYFGEYALDLCGDGNAVLFLRQAEYQTRIDKEGVDSGNWHAVDFFRYANPKEMTGRPHSLLIWPWSNAGIDFFSDTNDAAQFIAAGNDTYDLASRSATCAHTYVLPYPWKTATATVEEILRVDMHRALRLDLHVSKIAYPTGVHLAEIPTMVELSDTTSRLLNLGRSAIVPAGCSLNGVLVDGNTHAILAGDGTHFMAMGGNNSIYPLWNFESDGKHTPILLTSYLWKDPLSHVDEGEVFTGGFLRSVSVTSSTNDPTQETAALEIKDPADDLWPLGLRDTIPVAVQVILTPPVNGQGQVCLIRGYTKRSRARQMPSGANMFGRTECFPAKQWKSRRVTIVGMWERLSSMTTYRTLDFGEDGSADPDEDGIHPPWKITDVIRYLLSHCGFVDEMIFIPDLPYRLWESSNGEGKSKGMSYILNPNTNIAQAIFELAKDYLGGWIYFDANIARLGQWRLGTPPKKPYVPIFNFVSSVITPAFMPPAQTCGYPSNTSFMQASEEYPVAPEYNGIIILGDTAETTLGAGELIHTQWMVNKKSYGVQADKTSVDWKSWLAPLVVGDTSLLDQKSANFLCRRYYDFVCHGRLMREAVAPLVFVVDPEFGYLRPLRHYDVVMVDERASFVVSCNPDYNRSDFMQMAHYEFVRIPVGC